MPRRVQDILPADRRSIRDVPVSRAESASEPVKAKKTTGSDVRLPARKKPEPPAKETIEKITEIPIHRAEGAIRRMPITPPSEFDRERKPRRVWPYVTVGVVALIVVAGYFASTYFSRASFTIVPKTLPISVNSTYVALPAPGNGGLVYDVISLGGTASTSVAATDGPVTSTKATGKVTVYNAYSSQAMRLIAGTRLRDSSGRVYRLTGSIIIPGYTKPAATVIPGSIATTIVADQPGQSYNVNSADSVSDLKVVAYAGTAKYDSVYARLASDLSGGFTGVKKIVSPTLVASTTALLKSRLTSSLLSQIKSSVPPGYIMFSNAYATSFNAPVVDGGASGSAAVGVQGTAYVFIFNEDNLIKTFANSQSSSLFGQFAYTAPGLDALQITVTNLKDFTPSKKGSLVIRAKGDLKLIGTVPVDEIRKKLAGVSLAETQNIFKSYGPVIESGTGELVPPWAKVPSDQGRISVNLKDK